jgi:D-alanyl-D-alanine carboxypeptidase
MERKRRVACCGLLTMAALAACSDTSSTADIEQAVGTALAQELANHPEVRGAAVQVHLLPHNVQVRRTAGAADPAESVAMTEDTPFRTASITKMMTAAVVMQLIEEGRLSLATTLDQLDGAVPLDRLHVMGGVSSGRSITVEQLLRHRSGLADYFFDGPVDEYGLTPYLGELLTAPRVVRRPSELVAWTIENLPPVALPGAEYHYADTNYVLLGMLIENVEQRSLPEVYRSRLFAPLGMSTTYLECYEPAPTSALPAHTFYGDLDVTDLCLGEWGGGGIVTTLADLDQFVIGLARGTLFRTTMTRDAMLPTDEIVPGYGYGFGIALRQPPGSRFWGHDGAFACFAYYLPGEDAVVIATLNQVATKSDSLLRDLVLAAQRAAH